MLRHEPAGALVDEKPRIGRLVVVHRGRKGHEDRRGADGRNFSDGAGARAADDEVGVGKGARRVVDERGELGLHPSRLVAGAQCLDLPGAALVGNDRALVRRNQRQSFRHDFIQCLRTQTSTHDEHAQGSIAALEAFLRAGLACKGSAQRIAYPFGFAHRAGEGAEDSVGNAGEHLIGHAGDGILFVQDERLAEQHAHHARRKADVPAQAHHHIRPHAADHLDALPEGLEQTQRQHQQRRRSFPTYAAEVQRFKSEAPRRNQLALHAGVRGAAFAAQPMHAPATLTQGFGHGKAGEYVTAGSAGHDECAVGPAHTRPPLISTRFS
jgi:hypothetical protein